MGKTTQNDLTINLTACLEGLLHSIRPPKAPPLSAIAAEMLASKKLAERRQRYLTQLASTMRLFTAGREDRDINTITAAEIENWLGAHGWAPKTRLNYLVDVRTLFSFAMARDYCRHSVAMDVDKPLLEYRTPEFFPVERCREILEWCVQHDPGFLAAVPVMMFGGVRPDEVKTMPKPIDLNREEFPIAETSKTRSRRLVKILPPLRAWYRLTEPWPLVNWDKRLKALHGAFEPWPHDALRHTFCTYALSIYGVKDAARWAGCSENTFFKHYAALASRADACAFMALTPAPQAQQLEFPLAA